jgi:hypothetical protein
VNHTRVLKFWNLLLKFFRKETELNFREIDGIFSHVKEVEDIDKTSDKQTLQKKQIKILCWPIQKSAEKL